MPPLPPQLDNETPRAETLEAERAALELRRTQLQAEQAALEAALAAKQAALEQASLAARQAQLDAERAAMDARTTEAAGAAQANGVAGEIVPDTVQPGAPLSFVPHDAEGHVVPPRAGFRSAIRSARYGGLDQHDLVQLLDSIEDELARRRFRESIYISLFVWLLIVGLVFFGPKYLWHAPELISPAQAMKQHELLTLTNPVLPHHPTAVPKLDTGTLKKLRAMTPTPAAPPPAPVPSPAAPTPAPAANTTPTPAPPSAQPLPSAPSPVPRSSAPPVVDAPMPQPSSRPDFSTPNNASDSMRDLLRNSPHGPMGTRGSGRGEMPMRGGAMGGGGVEVLSDTQGVDFSSWLRRMHDDVMRNWAPLLPEETYAPLSKKGETYIVITILPDGKIGGMRLEDSTHDVAIDRSAWGALVSEGQYESLPKEFHGPNLILRCHFIVN